MSGNSSNHNSAGLTNEEDDDDIFIIRQVKPVLKITREQALKIKSTVLQRVYNDDGKVPLIEACDAVKAGSSNSNGKPGSNNQKLVKASKKKKHKSKNGSISRDIELKKKTIEEVDDVTGAECSRTRVKTSMKKSNKKFQFPETKKEVVPKPVHSTFNRTLTVKLDRIDKHTPRKRDTENKLPVDTASKMNMSSEAMDERCHSTPVCHSTPNERKPLDNRGVSSSASKKAKLSFSPNNKSITDYYSPTKKLTNFDGNLCNVPVKSEVDNNKLMDDPCLIQLSRTGLGATIKTENGGQASTSSNTRKNRKTPSKSTCTSQETSPILIKTNSFDLNVSEDLQIEDQIEENPSGLPSSIYSQIFEIMIHSEVKKQSELQVAALENKIEFEKLILSEECEVISTFFSLDEPSKQLYVRMIGRKPGWHRISNIKYHDISKQLFNEVMNLKDKEFLDVNIHNEDLKLQLDMLNKSEIIRICKLFKVPLTSPTLKKEDIIIQLLIDNKKQRSVMDMFKKNGDDMRLRMLKEEVRKSLGTCIQLTPNVRAIFNRIILLFSLFHEVTDETKRFSEQFIMMLEALNGKSKYVDYVLSPTVIFTKRDDLLMFEKAKILQVEFDCAILSKNFTQFQECAMEAQQAFRDILKDKSYRIRISHMSDYLKRYSAGSAYAGILTTYCERFKRKTDPQQVVTILTMLLDQQVFSSGSRGKWYELLTLAYECMKLPTLAAKVMLMAKRDEKLSEVKRLVLQMNAKTLVKRKSSGIDEELKERLDEFSTTVVLEPQSIEINGKAMDNSQGARCVFIHEGADEAKIYCSVEKLAIFHYKDNGYREGIHAEGEIIHTIYYLLFFDIIFEIPQPVGVFQSPYQVCPLDFNSSAFYKNRRKEIDARLDEMDFWTADIIQHRINKLFHKYSQLKCLVPWKDRYTADMFCDVIECLGMGAVKAICSRLVKNYRVTRSGFPDLTLWNVATKRCKFVEVKSANDKLAPNQRLWLDFLRSIGVDCEVCNVRNVASKRLLNLSNGLNRT